MQRATSSLRPAFGGADFLRNSKFCALDFMITPQVPAKNSFSGTFRDTFGTFCDIRRALVAGERNPWPQKHTIRFAGVKGNGLIFEPVCTIMTCAASTRGKDLQGRAQKASENPCTGP